MGPSMKEKFFRATKSQLEFLNAQAAVKTALEKKGLPAAASQPIPQLPFDLYKTIKPLVENEKPMDAFRMVKEIESFYPQNYFFYIFASIYYRKNFAIFSNHLKYFFQTVERLRSTELETAILKRMNFLVKNKEYFMYMLPNNMSQADIRLRYMKDITKLTPENFNPKNLICSFERRMTEWKSPSLRHINISSKFYVEKAGSFPIFQYNGPVEYLPEMYTYLLNANQTKNPLIVFFDAEHKSMKLFNEDKTFWLRITPHEYSNPKNIHIHINEFRPIKIRVNSGLSNEIINFNISIPLMIQVPRGQDPAAYLYKWMIEEPIKKFKQNPNVQIVNKSVF